MLKHRLPTAILLIALVLLALYKLPVVWFAALFAAVFLYAGWEWSRLAGLKRWGYRISFLVVLAMLMLQAWYYTAIWLPLFSMASIAWLVLGLLLVGVARRVTFEDKSHWLRVVLGWLLLFAAWSAVLWLRDLNPSLLLFALLMVWSSDSGAYFAGKALGRHKLAPRISPGKTWEGFLGGIVIALFVALVYLYFVPVLRLESWVWVVLVVVTSVVTVVGDLFESALKRLAGVKDSGNLLPGHGGILDRVDGMIAALPVFIVLYLLFVL